MPELVVSLAPPWDKTWRSCYASKYVDTINCNQLVRRMSDVRKCILYVVAPGRLACTGIGLQFSAALGQDMAELLYTVHCKERKGVPISSACTACWYLVDMTRGVILYGPLHGEGDPILSAYIAYGSVLMVV